MRKRFLNPRDMFYGIFGVVLSLILLLAVWILGFLGAGEHPISLEMIWIGTVLSLFLLILLAYFTICVKKYRGWLYYDGSHLLLKKGKREIEFQVSDIRWIDLQQDTRGARSRGYTSRRVWIFCIRLINQKKDLEFFITNNIMLEIIENHKIRIMPNEYNRAYLEGSMDLRKYKLSKSKKNG